MQYELNKAIELYQKNILTKKEKRELPDVINLDRNGSYYALLFLGTCNPSEDDKNKVFPTLLKNASNTYNYLEWCKTSNIKISKEERELCVAAILKSFNVLSTFIEVSCTFDELIPIIRDIKPLKHYEDTKDKDRVRGYDNLIKSLLLRYFKERKYSITNSDKILVEFLKNTNVLFNIMMVQYNDIQSSEFNERELRIIYKHRSEQLFKLFKTSLPKLIYFCYVFQNYIDVEKLELLVKMVMKLKDCEVASSIVKRIKMPDELKDQLNALIIMGQLTKE